ncbi:hypothetical protein quinque_012181 [Culex quinquefasciatus]
MLRLAVIAALIVATLQQNSEYKFKCGVRQFNLTGLATSHDWSAAGDWPWHVAVFVQPEEVEGHVCSGVLISLKFALTTDGCVTNRDGVQSWAKHTTLQLGRETIGEQTQRYQVFSIERFGGLALLKFNDLDFFTSYIQPICINQVASGKGKFGTVVGWDKEDRLTGIKLQIVGNHHCDEKSDSDVLCLKNDPNICDDGEIVYLRRGNSWFMGGFMSNFCGTNVLFNGLLKYLSWIRRITKLHYLEESDESCQPIDVEPEPFYYLLSHFPSSCGKYTINKIAGGHAASVFEFPWMAIVLYREDGSDKLSPLCMGSLINQRYVMTTAQCANGDPFKPYRVRLGEHTIDQEEDCNANDEEDCAPPILDVDVECSLGHQGYDHGTKLNNIGLIRIARVVQFQDHIQPVCLPGTYDLARTQLPNYIVSGWGRNETRHRMKSLRKAIVSSVDEAKCRTQYALFGLTLVEDQFCAEAGAGSSGSSCHGDVGAPLGYTAGYYGTQQFVQFGIAAFGTFGCREAPSVYTNVSVHVGWIIGNVRP